ncbi:hypothetical protein CHCC14820_4403 [Bacillus paralicheniformis]|nr:hypothetical protein CHCC14820_4403 [Bacillus paralicheniformis]
MTVSTSALRKISIVAIASISSNPPIKKTYAFFMKKTSFVSTVHSNCGKDISATDEVDKLRHPSRFVSCFGRMFV